jgi:thiamine pyrophosphate-dependent acetolactate synthase large subunit-like protein
VVLDGIDIVQLAGSFGVEGRKVDDESEIDSAVQKGLDTVEREGRPMVLDVKLPLGVPTGGKPAKPVKFADMNN